MCPMENLTKRQREVYEFIRDKIRNRGYGPTVREIGQRFGISSPNGVMCHLKALERKGLIVRAPHKSRAIELTREALDQERGLPLAGVVAAGLTTLAFEQNERIDFSELLNKDGYFALRVSGDSMIDAQIADGDYVIVRRQQTAAPGQIAVAQTSEGEATLKYWYPETNRVRLQPANPDYPPMYLSDAAVVGVVVAVVRRLA